MRKGLGAGLGMGYKNIAPLDSHIHSLSAKGVRSASTLYAENKLTFGIIPTQEKEGLIREIARKSYDGVSWAVQWEREHLPSQRRWVKKEYERAKEQLQKGVDYLKKDKDDVRDELDTDDDGDQDIQLEELHDVNTVIRSDLEGIDIDSNNVPDYVEEDELYQIPDKVEYDEQLITFPMPTLNPKDSFGSKFKKGVQKGVGAVVQKEREFVAHRKEDREMLNKLSDKQLEEFAVRNPAGIFGGNKYEKELVRRQTKRVQIKQKVAQTTQDAKSGKSTGAGFDLGFLNPLSTSSPKKK